ncbi:hypothetical protein ABPG74_011666 [Tetrahymena malaccensis]
MNQRDSVESCYQRSGTQQTQRSNTNYQIATDNYIHHFEPAISRVEFGSADSYITPPARQLEQLEQKNSWFHPPKKSKKFVRRYLDSSEMQQISKKLNFFDDSLTGQSISSSDSSQTQQSQNIGFSVGVVNERDQIDSLELTNAYSMLSISNNNPQNQNQSGVSSMHNNGNTYFNKNRNSTGNTGYSHQYPGQQNIQNYSANQNNNNNYKYTKAPSNPESILKFR